MDVAAQVPRARLTITNVRTGDFVEAQFNPSRFQEDISVNYARPAVLGLSHQPLQYLGTTNLSIPIELFFLSRDIQTHDNAQHAKRFLQSLCYPSRGSDSIVAGQPPRALVSWAKVVSLTCKLVNLSVRSTRFNIKGEVVQYTARCQFEEMRDVRWTSEDAFRLGSLRTGEKPGGDQ